MTPGWSFGTRDSLQRARIAGALWLLGAFGLGCGSMWWVLRDRGTGVRVMITATDALPSELQRLRLSDTQRSEAQAALSRGRDRVLRVVDSFEPAMQSAMDSTDQEIRLMLTDTQRAQLDSSRALHGPTMRRERKVRP